MGYRELLQALEEEVGRRIRQLHAEASQEREWLMAATRQELAARREKVLEEERKRLEEDSARTLSRARLEQERTILGEARRELAELQREAEARLAAINDPGLLARLFDELVSELGEGPVELRVAEGDEEPLQKHLGRHHPDLLPRTAITGCADVRGGVEASLGGQQLLDNTLPSRLRNAWQLLESEIAARLLEEKGEAVVAASGSRRDPVAETAPPSAEPVAAGSRRRTGNGEQ